MTVFALLAALAVGVVVGVVACVVVGKIGLPRRPTKLGGSPEAPPDPAAERAADGAADRAADPRGDGPAVTGDGDLGPVPGQAGDERGIDRALRDSVDHLEIGVMVFGGDRSVVYRNRSADAMLGTHVGLLVDEHVERMVTMAGDGRPSAEVLQFHGPPAVSVEIAVVPVAGGAAVATISDVSERTRIDAMRTDFVANVSHELRTPVGAIAVLAETLLAEAHAGAPERRGNDRGDTEMHEPGGPGERSDLVERVAGRMVDESLRAVRTLDDLLELSRIEAALPANDVVDLSEVLEAAIARGRVTDPTGRVDVTLFGLEEPVHLRGDQRQLSSAVGNLVENAVKYSPDGGAVQLRARVDGRHVELMVADQGIGIPQRDLDRIFERFYRVDKGRSRGTGGTGLGLAIVRHVAGNHGGDVVVSSTEGEGSTFVLRLPAHLVVEAAGSAEVGA